MKAWIRKSIAVALICAVAGCQTMRPPRVPPLPNASDTTNYEAAVGTITVSTPLLTPLIVQPDGDNRLQFGELKKEDKIRESIRSASLSRSLLNYEALSAAVGITVAGTQVDSSRSVATNSNVAGSADLYSLLEQALKLDAERTKEAEAPKKPNLAADFSRNAKSNYTETFKSPTTPNVPDTPAVPEAFLGKMAALFAAEGSYKLDPTQEARLIASTKAYMTALEEFYNLESIRVFEAEKSDTWQPYKLTFSVTLDPGWYTYLKQYDGVLELNLWPTGENLPDVQKVLTQPPRIVNVTPAETAQTLDELTSSFEQLSSALNIAGGFRAVAAQGLVKHINALAQRLQGFHKQNNIIVSYPDQSTIRIRFKPTVVPSAQLAETQATSMVFSATVLVNPELKPLSDVRGNRNRDLLLEATPVAGAKSLANLPLKVAASYESEAQLKLKGHLPGTRAPFFRGPRASQRESLDVSPSNYLWAILPAWPEKEVKKFGFAKAPTGYYDLNGSVATGYITYVVSNPPAKDKTLPKVELSVDDRNIGQLGGEEASESLVGVANIGSIPFVGDYGSPVRVLVTVSRQVTDSGNKPVRQSEIAPVTLVPRVELSPSAASITVDRAGLKLDSTPLNDLDPDVVKALIGNQVIVYDDEPK